MADFYAEAKKTQNKSKDNMMLTENGAVVYSSIGSEMVDFEFSVNSLRNKSKEEIYDKIKKAYAENPELTTKMIFQIGDVREGKGERHIFDACLEFLANEHPKILRELLPLIPEYTRWDHAIRLATNKNPMIAKTARKFVADQIAEDKKNLANGFRTKVSSPLLSPSAPRPRDPLAETSICSIMSISESSLDASFTKSSYSAIAFCNEKSSLFRSRNPFFINLRFRFGNMDKIAKALSGYLDNRIL